MGTSKQYGGPKAGNPLIPDWLPDPLPQTEPSEPVGEEPSENPTEEQEPHQNNHEDQQAKLPTFMPARNAFTRFSKSGDSKHLHKALSNYVGRGTGGESRVRFSPVGL